MSEVEALNNEALEWVLDAIEHDLDNDATTEGVVVRAFFRAVRACHVLTAEDRAAIGRVVGLSRRIESLFASWGDDRMGDLGINFAKFRDDLDRLARLAKGGGS